MTQMRAVSLRGALRPAGSFPPLGYSAGRFNASSSFHANSIGDHAP